MVVLEPGNGYKVALPLDKILYISFAPERQDTGETLWIVSFHTDFDTFEAENMFSTEELNSLLETLAREMAKPSGRLIQID